MIKLSDKEQGAGRRSWPWIGVSSLSFFLLTSCLSGPTIDNNSLGLSSIDILVSGGTVFMGNEGEKPVVTDVGIKGDRIVFIGEAESESFLVKDRIDARGLTVAPGFIDPHTHADAQLFSKKSDDRQNLNYLTQGVTTVFIGNDGGGDPDISGRKKSLSELGIGTNVALLVGHGSVRRDIIGLADRAPMGSELDEMKQLVARAMCDGAFGFSSGLYYTPQNYAETEEVVSLARESGLRGGYYDTHIRDESSYTIGLRDAISEAIEIGRRSGAPTHISHIKALGRDVWGASSDVIELVEEARAQGHSVTADQYPWLASGTRVSNALLPAWALDGGLSETRKRLQTPSSRAKIKTEMAENLRRRGGADSILITRVIDVDPNFQNSTLEDISVALKMEPIEAAIAILTSGDAQIASFNMKDADVENFMTQSWVMTGSDGSSGHPRKFASFPQKFSKYVRDKKTITLSDFIYRSSGLAAETFGLDGRGFIKTGYFADIVVFDPLLYKPNATYADPEQLSEGVVDLIVNGEFAIKDQEVREGLAGRVLSAVPDGGPENCLASGPP